MKTRGRNLCVFLLLVVAACGGGDGGSASTATGPAPLGGTLAYVEGGCRENPSGLMMEPQVLRIRAADGVVVTAAEVPGVGPFLPDGTCQNFGAARFGFLFRLAGAIQRLAVSPDGSGVVFEVSEEFTLPRPLTPEQQGFFFVRADGTGLRRLGPASREPTYRFLLPSAQAPLVQEFPDIAFSPSGRAVAFTDNGFGPTGETNQIFTLDVATGRRTQVTRLPVPPGADPPDPATCCPRFLDDQTITFPTLTDVDGSNPNGDFVIATIGIDGTRLKVVSAPVPLPNSRFVPQFSITGTDRSAVLFAFDPGGADFFREVFLVEGDNLLQLTNFHRFDTSDPLLSTDRSRVFFVASANPLGTNQSENCQIFSIDTIGAGLRQVTDFQEGERSANGCFFTAPPGCAVSFVGQDAETETLVIHSNCDPLGSNPNGAQVFALRPDGSGIRQLTDSGGLVTETDGTVMVQLPAPFAYSAVRR